MSYSFIDAISSLVNGASNTYYTAANKTFDAYTATKPYVVDAYGIVANKTSDVYAAAKPYVVHAYGIVANKTSVAYAAITATSFSEVYDIITTKTSGVYATAKPYIVHGIENASNTTSTAYINIKPYVPSSDFLYGSTSKALKIVSKDEQITSKDAFQDIFQGFGFYMAFFATLTSSEPFSSHLPAYVISSKIFNTILAFDRTAINPHEVSGSIFTIGVATSFVNPLLGGAIMVGCYAVDKYVE